MPSYSPKSVATLPPIMKAETLRAQPGVVDLHCFFYEEMTDAERWAAYFALLTPAEQARHDRFYFERDRRLFLATRALVRCVLSEYASVEPAAWRFQEGERGKPFIASPKTAPLHFNLSNTYGLVVCAISTAHAQLGVDAECIDRPGETVSLAEHYFSPAEVRALQALPDEQKRERFFAYWTLKESYIKARGLGLALPLEQFSFELEDEKEIAIAFDPRLADDKARWRFALLRASFRHLVAVGVDSAGAALSLRAGRYVPLAAEVSA